MLDQSALTGALTLLTASWGPWLVIVPGLLIGLIFAAIPGLSISIAMAVFLPSTAYMDFLPAILFLSSIFTGGTFGSAIPAVLINIPGQAAAVATTLDGYPMARKGLHNEAMGLALMASCVGAGFGYVILFFLVNPLSGLVLKLGPSEMFIVALWGITLIAALRGRNVPRGLLAGVFGLLVGTIGMSARGSIRGTMDITSLLDGVPVIPAMLGMFAASELFNLMGAGYIVDSKEKRRINAGGILRGMIGALRYPGLLFQGTVIGTLIGAVPGVGAAVACLVSYSEARRRGPDSDRFGTGDPRGVIAAESANSSSEAGSMATLLALGIPGGGGTAVMLGAFAMHNITGGPRFIADHKDLVYAVILSNFAQVAVLVVVGFAFIYFASSIVKVPLRLLVPSVLALSVLGSYAITGNSSGPVTLAVFSALGWLMRRYDFPIAATVIGLLLGRMAEGALLRTYQISGGTAEYFLHRPLTLAMAALLLFSLLWPALKQRLNLGPRHNHPDRQNPKDSPR